MDGGLRLMSLKYISKSPLGEDSNATDQWAKLLQLTVEERVEFDRLGREFVDGFSAAKIAHAVVDREPDRESVLVWIVVIPEEGARLKTSYVRGMQDLLGYDRERLMTAVLGYSL